MKWLKVKENESNTVFCCSVCNSQIEIDKGEELPYCKHCESEVNEE